MASQEELPVGEREHLHSHRQHKDDAENSGTWMSSWGPAVAPDVTHIFFDLQEGVGGLGLVHQPPGHRLGDLPVVCSSIRHHSPQDEFQGLYSWPGGGGAA